MTEEKKGGATAEEVREWMRERAKTIDSALLLAREANEHFRRPFHINVITDMARKIYQDVRPEE